MVIYSRWNLLPLSAAAPQIAFLWSSLPVLGVYSSLTSLSEVRGPLTSMQRPSAVWTPEAISSDCGSKKEGVPEAGGRVVFG